MIRSRRKPRRMGAIAARHQHVVAMLSRTIAVMLPAWLAYFFAVSLFARRLDAIVVPYVDMPLGTYLVIQGSAVVFTITLYLLSRAFGSARPR